MNKQSGRVWVGNDISDITDETLRALFEYMWIKSEETGCCELSIDGFGTMTFERELFNEQGEDRDERPRGK